MQVRINLHDGFGRHGMCTEAGVAARQKSAVAIRWFCVQAGIDEEDALPPQQIKGMLDVQLEVGKTLDTCQSQGFDAFDEQRAERVIAA